MRKNDKRSLPPSGRDRIIRTRIMRKREPERRSTKSFAQDRGSTGFLRMVLRAHNASARTIGRERKRILRRENSAKTTEQRKFERSVLLARSESQKVGSGLRGGEQSRATRARRVADER